MKSKKLTLFSSLTVAALLLCFVLPCLFVGTANVDVAYAAAGNYYSGITATGGTALLGQLHDLMVKTRSKYTTYAECKSKATDTDPGSASGTVMEFYTQADISASKFDVPGGWNREHVWPKANSNGLWKDTVGGGADLHHIRPAEKDINNARGNLLYGETSNGSAMYATGISGIIGGYSSGGVFEPIDKVKGDVARICMYVYAHYNTYSNVGGTTNGSGNNSYFGTLKFTDNIKASNEDAAIKLLLKWNKLDPVDDIERNRNEEIYKIQGNRNPFIDNESYADAIWGNGTVVDPVDPVTPTLTAISLTPGAINLSVGGTQTLAVNATPSNANANVTWSSSNTSVATVNNGLVTAVSAGSATITVTSVVNSNIKATATVTVNGGPVITAIELLGGPVTTLYEAGQTFDPTGIIIKATYESGAVTDINPVDDPRFQWVDAVSGQATLTTSTTKIKCKVGDVEAEGDFTVTVVAAPKNVENFVATVEKIPTLTTLQYRFEAISSALWFYNETQKRDSEKDDPRVKAAYQTLLQLIDDYNNEVQQLNDGMEKATDVGGSAVCVTMLAAVALVFVLKHKFK